MKLDKRLPKIFNWYMNRPYIYGGESLSSSWTKKCYKEEMKVRMDLGKYTCEDYYKHTNAIERKIRRKNKIREFCEDIGISLKKFNEVFK